MDGVRISQHGLPSLLSPFDLSIKKKTTTTTQLGIVVPRAEPLIPESNPMADATARSSSGVSYVAVKSGLDSLYPPTELDARTALSRSDGYWPYLQKGIEPPKEFTYGEFDCFFFAQLLDLARQELSIASSLSPLLLPKDEKEWTFVDLGSGTGRLVFAGAALHSWKKCRGIEMLPSIHQTAVDNAKALRCRGNIDKENEFSSGECNINTGENSGGSTNEEMLEEATVSNKFALPYILDNQQSFLPLSPVEFVCGSFQDPYIYFGDADVVFIFSSCLPSESLHSLAVSLGRQCKPGTIIITTDFILPLEGSVPPLEDDPQIPSGEYELEMVQRVEGWTWITGGESTAYVHRVRSSPWTEDNQGPWERPKVSVEDMCFKVAMALEAGELTDTKAFLRGVYNNMVFCGLPERWYAHLRDRVHAA